MDSNDIVNGDDGILFLSRKKTGGGLGGKKLMGGSNESTFRMYRQTLPTARSKIIVLVSLPKTPGSSFS
jgi:hypothetical protein